MAEASDASGTGYYDIVERCWSKSKMAAVDPNLCDYVPPLIGPNDIVGNLLSEVADILGLHQGVTVSPGKVKTLDRIVALFASRQFIY